MSCISTSTHRPTTVRLLTRSCTRACHAIRAYHNQGQPQNLSPKSCAIGLQTWTRILTWACTLIQIPWTPWANIVSMPRPGSVSKAGGCVKQDVFTESGLGARKIMESTECGSRAQLTSGTIAGASARGPSNGRRCNRTGRVLQTCEAARQVWHIHADSAMCMDKPYAIWAIA